MFLYQNQTRRIWEIRLAAARLISQTETYTKTVNDRSFRQRNKLVILYVHPNSAVGKKPFEGDWPKTVKLTPGTATRHFNTRLFNADVSQLSVNWPLITNGFMCLIRQVWDRIHRCGPILITFCPPHSCVSEPIPLSPFAVQVLEKIYRRRTDEKHAKIKKMAFKNA